MSLQNPVGLVVLDGGDGTGKSTLADYLVEHHGAVKFHQSHDKTWNMFDYFTGRLQEAVARSNEQLVVMDRLWMSELVYGAVYRGGSGWQWCGRMVERVVAKHAGLYVLCVGDPEVLAARHARLCQTREEMFSTGNDAVAAAYNGAVTGDGFMVGDRRTDLGGPLGARPDLLTYQIEKEGADLAGFSARLLARLAAHRAAQFQPALDPAKQNVLGHLGSADTLLVGDVTNPKQPGLNWPFYEYGNCSLFLVQVLAAVGWREPRGMWTNANDREEHLPALLAAKKWRMVVALGAKAEARCGGKAVLVAHPQHQRRFGALTIYAEELRRVLF